MNNRIVVFIDFDGTLYDNKTRTIPESTIETLRKYQNKYQKCAYCYIHLIFFHLQRIPVFDFFVLIS